MSLMSINWISKRECKDGFLKKISSWLVIWKCQRDLLIRVGIQNMTEEWVDDCAGAVKQ